MGPYLKIEVICLKQMKPVLAHFPLPCEIFSARSEALTLEAADCSGSYRAQPLEKTQGCAHLSLLGNLLFLDALLICTLASTFMKLCRHFYFPPL